LCPIVKREADVLDEDGEDGDRDDWNILYRRAADLNGLTQQASLPRDLKRMASPDPCLLMEPLLSGICGKGNMVAYITSN
jgi:hypothetical protein